MTGKFVLIDLLKSTPEEVFFLDQERGTTTNPFYAEIFSTKDLKKMKPPIPEGQYLGVDVDEYHHQLTTVSLKNKRTIHLTKRISIEKQKALN